MTAPQSDQTVIDLYQAGNSMSAITKATGLSHKTIRQKLKKAGIRIRSQAEQWAISTNRPVPPEEVPVEMGGEVDDTPKIPPKGSKKRPSPTAAPTASCRASCRGRDDPGMSPASPKTVCYRLIADGKCRPYILRALVALPLYTPDNPQGEYLKINEAAAIYHQCVRSIKRAVQFALDKLCGSKDDRGLYWLLLDYTKGLHSASAKTRTEIGKEYRKLRGLDAPSRQKIDMGDVGSDAEAEQLALALRILPMPEPEQSPDGGAQAS